MNITAKHKQAIELLAAGQRITDVAELVNVERRTVYNWLDDPAFTRALQKRQSAYIRRLNTRLIALNEKALDVLAEGLDSRQENIRVRCAAIVAGKYHKTIEFEDILQRLERLENRS
jgi:transposase